VGEGELRNGAASQQDAWGRGEDGNFSVVIVHRPAGHPRSANLYKIHKVLKLQCFQRFVWRDLRCYQIKTIAKAPVFQGVKAAGCFPPPGESRPYGARSIGAYVNNINSLARMDQTWWGARGGGVFFGRPSRGRPRRGGACGRTAPRVPGELPSGDEGPGEKGIGLDRGLAFPGHRGDVGGTPLIL